MCRSSGYVKWSQRPVVASELAGVELGMAPIKVTLAKGKPSSKGEPELDEGGKYHMPWLFHDPAIHILFSGNSTDDMKASIICQMDGYEKLLNLGRFDSEDDIIDKFGEPSRESISKSGLSKMISFERWKVAYELTEGEVSAFCVKE